MALRQFYKKIALALFLFGSFSSSLHALSISPRVKVAATVTAFAFPFISSYIALTQDKQPILEDGTGIEKLINWYRRVVCGQASKKTQALEPSGAIKDVYSESSGIFGKLITWYEANEKDIKKAAGLGVLFALATINTDLADVLSKIMQKAPYAELFKYETIRPNSKQA